MNHAFSPFPPDPVAYDASDEAETKRRELEAKRRERSTQTVLTHLFETKEGRDWMWDILSQAHMFEVDLPSDWGTQSQRLGERNLGIIILTQILRHAPSAFIQMMQERS